MAAVFRKGDLVEVWSNGRQAWIADGVIVEAAASACILDGYAVPAGAVKVSSSAGIKWILPDMMASNLRRPKVAGVPAPSPSAPASGDGERLCKLGCGRPVQPGMTRGMKRFDTCCKRCARAGGATGEHDANCGGAQPARPPPSGPARDVHVSNPACWLQGVLASEESLARHSDAVFQKVASGQDTLCFEKLREAAEHLQPIGAQPRVPEATLEIWVRRFGGGRDALDAAAFRKFCRFILEDRQRAWFPQRLPAKAKEFVTRNSAPVEAIYKFGPLLGEGSFGKVFSVTHRISGEHRVCKKIMKLKGRAGMQTEEILQEIESMAMLDHPNVIKVYEYFEDAECVAQIMEPCNGGELQEKIDAFFKKGQPAYNEAFICDVVKQTLRGLAFMHSERFMHKDLKPQNIMLADGESSSIKVIDFGLAELFERDQKVSAAFGGTLLYMAPEAFRRELTFKSDVWSLGVILYNLLTGDYPFMATWPLPPGKDIDWWHLEVERAIREEPYRQNPRLSSSASAACRSLLVQMLEKDSKLRPDAAACLEHPWFKQFESAPPPLSVGLVQCLDAYAGQPQLKQAIFLLMAHQCTAPALQELRAIFTHFDIDNRGALATDSVREVLGRTGMAPLRVSRIVHVLDKDGSGTVEWTEFIAAALCVSVCKNKRLVGAAFSLLDRDHDGLIATEDFVQVFAKGEVEDLWRKGLPHECAMLAGGGAGPYTKEQFETYVGRHMTVTSGDALCAVD